MPATHPCLRRQNQTEIRMLHIGLSKTSNFDTVELEGLGTGGELGTVLPEL